MLKNNDRPLRQEDCYLLIYNHGTWNGIFFEGLEVCLDKVLKIVGLFELCYFFSQA